MLVINKSLNSLFIYKCLKSSFINTKPTSPCFVIEPYIFLKYFIERKKHRKRTHDI